ncbi:DUF397 domain-containing protein [Streptomyces sodiiphilus]|uniref:DUF397 domain-containing protein n=1 Tax=Streptomyces sodiiphilus TaxID=226217 RepID=UPI0031DB47D4
MVRDRENTQWQRSSYSGQGGNCLEMAPLRDRRLPIRDSKYPDGPALTLPAGSWTSFISALKRDEATA